MTHRETKELWLRVLAYDAPIAHIIDTRGNALMVLEAGPGGPRRNGAPPSLTFGALRCANLARLPLFKNARGEPAHSQPDGSDWSLGDWMTAVVGEIGEAANVIKKVQRGDLTLDEARPLLAKEFADGVTYLDILAFRCGIDLGDAAAAKWDEISERVEVPLRIADFTEQRA